MPKITLQISERHYKAAEELALLYKKPVIQWLTEELETHITDYLEKEEEIGEVMKERISAIFEGGQDMKETL